MGRIVIEDLAKDREITKEEMKRVVGGYRFTSISNFLTVPMVGIKKPISWGGDGGDPTSPLSWGGDGGEPT